MLYKYFLKTLLLFSIYIDLTLSQNSTKTESATVLKINKCSTSIISEGSIYIPKHFVRKSINFKTDSTAEQLEIRLSQSTKALDCSNPPLVLNVTLNSASTEEDFDRPYFLSNGYLKYNQTNLSPDEFCFESKSEINLQLKVCIDKPVCSTNSPCIQKCCEVDEVIDLSQFASEGRIGCRRVNPQKTWTPSFYKDSYTKIFPTNAVKINYIPHHPKSFCEDGMILMSLRPFDNYETVSPFRILGDGSITEKVGRTGWTLVDSLSFCVDGAQNFPLSAVNDGDPSDLSLLSGPYTGDEKDTVVIDCRSFVASERDVQNEKFTGVYVLALGIATIFLILTLLAHIVLWKRQTIRGWALMCYVTFLAMEFILLIIARIISERGVACSTTGIGVHFTALSTFSWLTIMNFDVFWSFRTMNPCTTRKQQLKLFLLYAVFATAIPVCIVGLGLILESIYGDDGFSEVIVPEYGKTRCGLGESAEFPYLFGPISILLTTNLIFLVVTLYYVFKHQQILKSNGIKTQLLKDKIRFFGMLFFVAGFTWIFDVLSWATTSTYESTPWYWMLFDFVNIFQAIAIFLIFVCNPTTLHHLQKKLPCLSNLNLWPNPADINLQTHGNAGQNDGFGPNRKLSLTQIFSSITDNGKAHFELNNVH